MTDEDKAQLLREQVSRVPTIRHLLIYSLIHNDLKFAAVCSNAHCLQRAICARSLQYCIHICSCCLVFVFVGTARAYAADAALRHAAQSIRSNYTEREAQHHWPHSDKRSAPALCCSSECIYSCTFRYLWYNTSTVRVCTLLKLSTFDFIPLVLYKCLDCGGDATHECGQCGVEQLMETLDQNPDADPTPHYFCESCLSLDKVTCIFCSN